MIEVEIRGRLDEESYDQLKKFLDAHGRSVEHHSRDMYLLLGYPGYTNDFVGRGVDIRLRNTDGKCEIMLKYKASESGVGRREVSLPLGESNLETAKEIVKALGYSKAIKMLRDKEVYEYQGAEWSLVRAPKGVMYYEIEKMLEDESGITKAKEELLKCARDLHLEVLDEKGTRNFISFLDREVNEVVEF